MGEKPNFIKSEDIKRNNGLEMNIGVDEEVIKVEKKVMSDQNKEIKIEKIAELEKEILSKKKEAVELTDDLDYLNHGSIEKIKEKFDDLTKLYKELEKEQENLIISN